MGGEPCGEPEGDGVGDEEEEEGEGEEAVGIGGRGGRWRGGSGFLGEGRDALGRCGEGLFGVKSAGEGFGFGASDGGFGGFHRGEFLGVSGADIGGGRLLTGGIGDGDVIACTDLVFVALPKAPPCAFLTAFFGRRAQIDRFFHFIASVSRRFLCGALWLPPRFPPRFLFCQARSSFLSSLFGAVWCGWPHWSGCGMSLCIG